MDAAKAPTGRAAKQAGKTPAPFIQAGSTRDKVLGYGAALAALMTVLGLTIAGVIVLIALGYVVAGFLAGPEKRDRRLRLGGWAAGALTLFMGLMVAVILGDAGLRPAEGEASLFSYLPLGGTTLILATASTLALALAAFLGGIAFGRESTERYRWLSRAALAGLFYFVILLPGTVVTVDAPTSLGSFWNAPMEYGAFVFNMLAVTALAAAFYWAAGVKAPGADAATPGSDDAAPTGFRLSLASREYLLLAAAVAFLLAQILGLTTLRWGVLTDVGDEAGTGFFAASAVYVARILVPTVLSAAAVWAFWVSCRQTGWELSHWSEPVRPGLTRLLLTWRLPWLYGWLVALVIACAFLGWYGFALAALAAAHYLWMLVRSRGSRGPRETDAVRAS